MTLRQSTGAQRRNNRLRAFAESGLIDGFDPDFNYNERNLKCQLDTLPRLRMILPSMTSP